MDTPRSPRRASHRICCPNRGGLTVTRYGSAWYGSIEWYMSTKGMPAAIVVLFSRIRPSLNACAIISPCYPT